MLELNVTEVPEQTVVPGLAVTVMVGATCEVTFIAMPALVTDVLVAQVAFELSTQVIWSPLVNVLDE